MARIRTIKPQFWGDDEIARLSIEARYLAIGLVSMADDDGRFVASVNAVSGYVFPHDDIAAAKIRRWLAEIEAVGFATFYRVGSAAYGCIPNYRNHQRISHPQPSPIPQPPAEHLRNGSAPLPRTPVSGMEWNGMEGISTTTNGEISHHPAGRSRPRPTDDEPKLAIVGAE